VPFAFVDSLPPQVSIQENFDDLLIPADHVSRSPHDTFYLGGDQVSRAEQSNPPSRWWVAWAVSCEQWRVDSLASLTPPGAATPSPRQVLRTHTSAHQVALMRAGNQAFLCTVRMGVPGMPACPCALPSVRRLFVTGRLHAS
jgi:phenylalanyl-tRNA synthetase alpha subunit